MNKLEFKNIQLYTILLVLYLIIAPFIYLNTISDSTLLPRLLSFSVINIIGLVLLIFSKSQIKISKLQAAFLTTFFLLVAWTYSSIFYAHLPSEVYIESSKLLNGLILSFLFLKIKRKEIGIIAIAVSLATIVFIVIACIQLKNTASFNLNSIALKSTLNNKNLFASFLLFSIPFHFISAIRYKSILLRAAILLLISTCLFFILLLQSRAVWLALFVCIIFMSTALLSLLWRSSKLGLIKKSFHPVYGIILLFVIIVGLKFGVQYNGIDLVKNKIETAFNYKNNSHSSSESIRERQLLWRNTKQLIAEHPIIGIGTGQWKIQYPSKGLKGYRLENGFVNYQRPHNDFLWIWSENGSIGLLLFIALFVISIIQCVRCIVRQNTIQNKFVSFIVLGGILSYIIVANFSFPKERILHSLLLFILLNIPFMLMIDGQQIIFKNKVRTATGFLLLLFSLGAFYKNYQILNSSKKVKHLLKSRISDKHQQVIKAGKELEDRNFDVDLVSMPIAWYIGEAYFNLEDKKSALIQFKKAYSIHPNNLHVLNNLGSSYHMLGQPDSALVYYKKALEISPKFSEANLNLTAIHYNKRNYDAALESILLISPDAKNGKYLFYLEKVLSKHQHKITLTNIDWEDCRTNPSCLIRVRNQLAK